MDIVLVAGLWLDGSAWAEVARSLQVRGHRAVPVALPGQGDGNTAATLADQVAAVVAAVDAADGRPLVVGHSASSGLAWLAADARRERVAGVVFIGGWPPPEGERYADFFPVRDGAMPFPGWEPFAGADSADLDEATKESMAAAAIPVPEGVSRARVHYGDERRYEVPAVLICPEFSAEAARKMVADGDLPELARIGDLTYEDLDSGHWPMFSAPDELAALLARLAERS